MIGSDEISLNPLAHAWVDSIAFEVRVAPLLRHPSAAASACELTRLERAMRLYCGDFLPDVDQDWAWIERQRLRSMYRDGLYLLISRYAAGAQWERALHWGLRLNREEPLREDVHRVLMMAHWQLGNRASAVAQYRACERLLATELGVQPMTETRSLARQLMRELGPAQRVLQLGTANPAELDTARRRIARVRKALAVSQQQLDRALDSLNCGRDSDVTQR